jgi:hypothetical protein
MGSLRDLRKREPRDTKEETEGFYLVWCDNCDKEINLYDCGGGYYQDFYGSVHEVTYCPYCGNPID